MQLIEGRMIYAPSDLNDALECDHLLELERRAALGELAVPERSETAALLARKGGEHEAERLRRYRAQ